VVGVIVGVGGTVVAVGGWDVRVGTTTAVGTCVGVFVAAGAQAATRKRKHTPKAMKEALFIIRHLRSSKMLDIRLWGWGEIKFLSSPEETDFREASTERTTVIIRPCEIIYNRLFWRVSQDQCTIISV
jgi:hypothetical protein